MRWNDHSDLAESHAFLGASKYHWINYSGDRLIESYKNYKAKELGTRLHAFAAECIAKKEYVEQDPVTLNMYINDAIDLRMRPEQVLYYSNHCYGTADSISFRNKKLRIHDLKTGTIVPGHMEQLMIYAALFCLEYDKNPHDIKIELRIYQNDTINKRIPDPDKIASIMDKIIEFDSILEEIIQEGK